MAIPQLADSMLFTRNRLDYLLYASCLAGTTQLCYLSAFPLGATETRR
jgi:hypothetical protein